MRIRWYARDLNSILPTLTLDLDLISFTRAPTYVNGTVPRAPAFNANVFHLLDIPRMPPIEVNCLVAKFDPATTPIFWRLQVRHVLCRFLKGPDFRYTGACEVLEDEWQGKSRCS